MSLEDQIAQMADARAAEVTTSAWTPGASQRPRGRWLAAVAAVVVLAAGLGYVLLSSDDPEDLETVEEATDQDFQRWVPAAGVESVTYGTGEPVEIATDVNALRLAPTPNIGEISVIDHGDGYTTVSIGYGEADPEGVVEETGGIRTLRTRRTARSFTIIRTSHLSAEQLALLGPRASMSMSTIVADIAGDDGTIVYEGEKWPSDATVSFGATQVRWTTPGHEALQAAYAAVGVPQEFDYGNPIVADAGPDYFVSALGLREFTALLEEVEETPAPELATLPVDASEWLTVVDRLLAESSEVSAVHSRVYYRSLQGNIDLSGVVATVVEHRGSFSLRLDLSGSSVPTNGGSLTLRIGNPVLRAVEPLLPLVVGPHPINLQFGPIEDHVLTLDARLLEAEAERYADLINGAFTAPESTPGQSGACTANAFPTPDILDSATHIADDETPLDLDLDGVNDEIFVREDSDEDWWLFARLQTGWTNEVRLGRLATPELTPSPANGPAAADLDGDGGLEFFVNGYGNTARNSAMLTTDGCTISRVRYEGQTNPEEADFFGLILHGVGGNSCLPAGCWPRVRCVGNELVQEMLAPSEEWRGQPDVDLSEVNLIWSATGYSLNDGLLTVTTPQTFEAVPADAPPPEAPSATDSDVIDCTVDAAAVARNDCLTRALESGIPTTEGPGIVVNCGPESQGPTVPRDEVEAADLNTAAGVRTLVEAWLDGATESETTFGGFTTPFTDSASLLDSVEIEDGRVEIRFGPETVSATSSWGLPGWDSRFINELGWQIAQVESLDQMAVFIDGTCYGSFISLSVDCEPVALEAFR